MTKEEYKAKVHMEARHLDWEELTDCFIEEIIDELWCLPEEMEEPDFGTLDYYCEGWNACIAEAERIRDLSIKL